jgi:exonuclease SbcC
LTLENFGPFVGKEILDFTSLDDIFLITGKTGSGKTTIFDALCFALYGTVPGSRGSHLPRLRSDYAEDGAECFVSLEFSLGERRYRIDRSPKRERPKQRGIGITTVDESAELYEIEKSGGTLIRVSGKKSEADRKIKELIGLSAEEFFKIVLLPQGEFAEFLKQNTTQRREVLGKLFPVDIAVRIRELVKERFNQAAAQVQEAERALGDLARRVSFDTFTQVHTQAEEALKNAKERALALAEESSRLRRILALLENEGNSAGRLAETRAQAAALEAKKTAIEEQESRLARSRKAQPLARYLYQETEKRGTSELSAGEYERARQDRAEAQAKAEEAERLRGESLGMEKELLGLREKRPRLQEILEEEETLASDARDLEQYRLALAELAEKKDSSTAVLEAKDREITRLQSLSDQGKPLNAQWERARDIKDALKRIRQLAGEGDELRSEAAAGRRRLEELTMESAELEQRIPVLREVLEGLEAEKEGRERADLAAHLAAELKPGEACPVCGSRDHPLPAAAILPVFGVDERIASQRRALKDAERDLTARQTEARSKTQEQNRLRQKLEALRESFAQARSLPPSPGDSPLPEILGPGVSLPEAETAAQALESHVLELNRLTILRDDAQRAGGRILLLYRERDDLLARRMELEKEHSGLLERQGALEKALGDLRDKHRRTLTEWNLPQAAEALEALDRRIHVLEERIRQLQDLRESADRLLAAAAARESAALTSRDEALRQYREAAAALESALAASPFGDAESLQGAILERDAEIALEEEIARWREERSRISSTAAELERTLESLRAERAALGSSPVPEEIPALLVDLETGREEAEAARDRASAELAALERDAALLQETSARHEELALKAARFKALWDDLKGDNPRKKSFDAWLLGRYLAEVAAFATRRLERMSESRYSLFLDSDGESGRGRAGLDLAVFDAYTGKTRPCGTLSGGESFMASISLALGLADSIQTRSGGVRLDAVFIDEGFGSLDEASLDKALVILDELREHRMVGLISHVGEMRSRIPSRVEVVKSGSGSGISIERT